MEVDGAKEEEGNNLLQLFWGLSSLEEEERLVAGRQLLLTLTPLQEASADTVCRELEYTVKRLVRGLASHRKGARQGYFTALTEVLSAFPQVPLSQVFELIRAHLESTGSAKALEERGVYFGQVFALLSVIQSGRLTEPVHVLEVLKRLDTCAQKKSYLHEFCAVATSRLVDACPPEALEDDVVPALQGLAGGWDGCTPETLLLLLHFNQHHAKAKWFKELVRTHWGGHKIASHNNFEHMAKILLESSSAHPRLHAVWPQLIGTVRQKGHFGAFWKTVVDDTLFLSSHERKFLGFKLVESLLPTLTASEVPLVLSPNLLHCLINNASSPDNYLHSAATHLLSEITSTIRDGADPSISVAIFLHLQSRTGSKFDHLSGTKTTKSILAKLDAAGLQQLVDQLEYVFHHPMATISDDESVGAPTDASAVQLWALDQLLALVRNHFLPRTDACLLHIAEFLIAHAFYQKAGEPALVKVVRQACESKLTSVLVELSAAVSQEKVEGGEGRQKFRRPGVMKDGEFFMTAVVLAADGLSVSRDWQLQEPLPEDDCQSWECVTNFIKTNKDNQAVEVKAFVLLLSAVGLQLLNSAERVSAKQLIQDVVVCREEMVASQTRTPRRKQRDGGSGATGRWMEVLTDVLLSLLSRPSQLWRVVVEQVFRMVAQSVTLASLEMILKVLEPDSKEEVMEREEEEEGEEEEEEEEEAASLAEDESDSDKEEGEGVDPVFRLEVRNALGAAAMHSDERSGSEDSMDDEAMMAVDEALAAVFRSRFAAKHQRKQKKDDERSMMHFRIRVLGLIDIFLRKHSISPLALELVVPLYRVIHLSHGKSGSTPLAERATGIFQKKLCQMKGCSKESVDGEHIHSLLHQMVEFLYKASPQTAVILTQGCMFLLRVLRGCTSPPAISPLTTRSGRKRKVENEETPSPSQQTGLLDVAKVTTWFSDALHDFMTKKTSSVHQVFFTTYIERYPALAWQLVGRMVEDLSAAANQFRKVQVYEMLAQLMTQPVDEKIPSALLTQVAPSLVSHCLGELPIAAQKPVKHARPVFRLLATTVSILRKYELSSLVDSEAMTHVVNQVTFDPTLSADVHNESDRLREAIDGGEVAMATPKKKKRTRSKRSKR